MLQPLKQLGKNQSIFYNAIVCHLTCFNKCGLQQRRDFVFCCAELQVCIDSEFIKIVHETSQHLFARIYRNTQVILSK